MSLTLLLPAESSAKGLLGECATSCLELPRKPTWSARSGFRFAAIATQSSAAGFRRAEVKSKCQAENQQAAGGLSESE